MDDMEPPEQFVETVVEDIHVGVDPGEEIVTSDSTVVTSSIGMNTIVYSQGPDGIIMEGDEIGGDIVSDIVTDSLTGKHSHILHSNLHHHQNPGLFVENLLNHHSIVVSSHAIESGFVAMKPQNVLGNSDSDQDILEENISDEMIVQENVEIEGEDLSHGEILLVPNSMVKEEDIIEGEEVVVGSSDGNEIVIDHMDGSRFFVDGTGDVGSDIIMDSNFDDSGLVIDTAGNLKFSDIPIPSNFCYDCSECGAMLKNRTALKKHIRVFHGAPRSREKPRKLKKMSSGEMNGPSSNRLYSCSSCSHTTPRRDKMDKHMQKHVLLEGYHPCGKKRLKTVAPPKRHRHNAEEYKCPLCPYTCTVYKALKKHHKTHLATGRNTTVLKISCKICGKDRATEADLQKHMKKHRDGKNFTCDICGFGSLQMKKTIQHRRMHTGEKPHLCPHCTYRSARRDNLRSHVRRMHKKENFYIDTFNPTEENNVPE